MKSRLPGLKQLKCLFFEEAKDHFFPLKCGNLMDFEPIYMLRNCIFQSIMETSKREQNSKANIIFLSSS